MLTQPSPYTTGSGETSWEHVAFWTQIVSQSLSLRTPYKNKSNQLKSFLQSPLIWVLREAMFSSQHATGIAFPNLSPAPSHPLESSFCSPCKVQPSCRPLEASPFQHGQMITFASNRPQQVSDRGVGGEKGGLNLRTAYCLQDIGLRVLPNYISSSPFVLTLLTA